MGLFGGAKTPSAPAPTPPPPPPPTLASAQQIAAPSVTGASASAGGIGSTILTSPQGVLGVPQTSRKSLLGA